MWWKIGLSIAGFFALAAAGVLFLMHVFLSDMCGNTVVRSVVSG